LLATSEPRIGTLQRLLHSHRFFCDWGVEQLKQLEGHCQLLELAANTPLLQLNALDPEIHFLLVGQLSLTDTDGHSRIVDFTDPDAAFPVARLRPSNYHVTTCASSQVLAIEQSVLQRLSAKKPLVRFRHDPQASGGTWQSHPLVQQVLAAADNGTLRLPTIPGISVKIRRALSKDDFSMAQIGQIIAADPVISAKLMRLANSALYLGADECVSVQGAVVRLGVSKVQNLVLALSTATLFETQQPQLRSRLVALWRHLVEIGATCASLARLNGNVDSDMAMLTGLLHEVGKIPILEMATRSCLMTFWPVLGPW